MEVQQDLDLFPEQPEEERIQEILEDVVDEYYEEFVSCWSPTEY